MESDIWKWMWLLLMLKNMSLGSDFNFLKWLKSPKQYWGKYIDWQRNRP